MSRIGKQLITVPAGVEVTIANGILTAKGPKGTLTLAIHPKVSATITDNTVQVSVGDPEEKAQRSLWGLFNRLIANTIAGVATGFSKQLEVNGVGYKAVAAGKVLNLSLGYSHPIDYQLPAGIEATVEKNIITISGADKQLVGQVAAEIRRYRKPEPYKGKGIKYTTETIRRKAGKTAAKGA